MSQEDKHIDNLFQEKLSDRTFDGAPADFIADLNQRLDAKPVVSKGWIWMIFLNFFIIGLFIANASIDWTSSKTAKAETQIENKENHTSKDESFKTGNEQNKIASKQQKIVQTDGSDENQGLNKKEEYTEGNKRNNTTEKSSGVTRIEKNQDNSSNNNVNKSNKQGGSELQTETANRFNNKTKTGSSSDNTPTNKMASTTADESNNKASKGANNVEGKDTKTNNADAVQKDQSVAPNTKGQSNKDKKEEGKTTKENVSFNGTESLSPYVSYSAIYAADFDEVDHTISTKDFPEFPNRWNEIITADNTPSKKSPQVKEKSDIRRFEIQLQGGATQWNFKTLGTNDDYVDKINQSGTSKWTPNFGLGFNMNFNNISIGTGLNYAKFKTENLFEFTEINTYDSTYIGGYNANVTYDSLGNPIDTTYTPYYDSTTVTDTSVNVTPVTNQYEWIQIPIHFGYRFNLNKWAIIPRVGMNIGIGIRQTSGQYPNEAYDELQNFSPVKWNLNLHTSLEVRRDFGNWHAFGKFNYQRNLTPTIDNALFERKFNGIGFNFGVGYSF